MFIVYVLYRSRASDRFLQQARTSSLLACWACKLELEMLNCKTGLSLRSVAAARMCAGVGAQVRTGIWISLVCLHASLCRTVESAAATSMRRKKLKSRTLSTLSLDATSQSLTLDIDQNDPERGVIVQLDRVPSGGHYYQHHVKNESSDSSLYGDGKGDNKIVPSMPGVKSDTANAAQYSPLDVTKPPPLNLTRLASQSSSGSSVQGTPTPPGSNQQQNALSIVPSGSMQPINTSRFHNAHSIADLSPRSRMKHLRAGSQPNLLKSDGYVCSLTSGSCTHYLLLTRCSVIPPSIFTPRPGALLMHVVPREALVRASRGTDLDDW